MDDADRAGEREEITLAEAMRNSRKPAGPLATGRCLWCDEIVGEMCRWCQGTECREMWEREQRFKR